MEKEKNNKKSVILIIVIIILLAVIGVLVWMILHPKQAEPVEAPAPEQTETTESAAANALAYDSSVVAMDEDSLQKAMKDLLAEEGTMALDMQVEANSSDGQNFTCDLANTPSNRYDMYMVLYLDETGEELYRSGLVPLGSKITSFSTNRKLDPGSYECTVVYNQVEDDHATTHAKVNIGLTLNVR